jgi:hypothetical protein
MPGACKATAEIIIKVPATTPSEKRQIAAEIVASLNRRGVPAAQVDFSDPTEDLRSFVQKQAERLTEAAAACTDADLRKLMTEMAEGWLRLVPEAGANRSDSDSGH